MGVNQNIPTELERLTITGDFGQYLTRPLDAKERLKVVARNMAMCRKEAGMSQKDVCLVIGCAPQTYSGYEKAKHEPTLETLVRLSHLYDVSLDFLLGKNENDALRAAAEDAENIEHNPSFLHLQHRMAELEQELQRLKNGQ